LESETPETIELIMGKAVDMITKPAMAEVKLLAFPSRFCILAQKKMMKMTESIPWVPSIYPICFGFRPSPPCSIGVDKKRGRRTEYALFVRARQP